MDLNQRFLPPCVSAQNPHCAWQASSRGKCIMNDNMAASCGPSKSLQVLAHPLFFRVETNHRRKKGHKPINSDSLVGFPQPQLTCLSESAGPSFEAKAEVSGLRTHRCKPASLKMDNASQLSPTVWKQSQNAWVLPFSCVIKQQVFVKQPHVSEFQH